MILSTGGEGLLRGVPALGGCLLLGGGAPGPHTRGEFEGGQVKVHTQGEN